MIRVFGREPGSTYSPVPGPGVGYMPQELALFPDFTIKETLRYFGQLYKMSPKDIKARTKFLITLLHLPEKNRLVSQLSGEYMLNSKINFCHFSQRFSFNYLSLTSILIKTFS